ncbi:MAG: cyclic nucleotide-binding domain-containing protein [Cyanobacteria bacterium P01_A01_bin.105]
MTRRRSVRLTALSRLSPPCPMSDLVQSFSSSVAGLFTRPLFSIGGTQFTLLLLFQLSLWLGGIFFAIGLLKNFLKRQLLVRVGIDASNREAIAALVSYFLGAIALLIAVQNSGVNLTSLGIILGGLGVGIGFGIQHVADDFISGVILLFERTLKVGDLIELDDYRFQGLLGRIGEVKLRSTIIRTLDNGDVVIPNSQLVKNRVLNWSYDTPIARLKIPVGVAYHSDPTLVTEALLKSAYMEPAVCAQPMPKAMFMAFGENALQFELWVWVDFNQRFDTQSSLHFIIEYNLRQQGIEIAFPQRDLWIRNPESLRMQPGTARPEPAVVHENQLPRPHASAHRQLRTTQPTLRDALWQVDYFENFSELELRQLIEIGQRQRCRAGHILFHEDDPGNAFYVVLEGKVEIVAEKLDRLLTVLAPGSFFGEISLILGIPRTAMARVAEDALLFVIRQDSFSRLLHRYPDLAEVILAEMNKHREELAQRQQEMRALNLLDAAEDDANPVVWARKRIKRLFSLA